jgi:HK97 family phage prohead protease
MNEQERRFTRGPVEVRAAGETRTIGGYAAKFNVLSRNLGGFVERIDTGFFAKSEGDGWPRAMARYNHDNNMLLGTSRSGTLRLVTDGVGLDYAVDVPDTRADVYELVQRGDVAESSFAFRTLDDDWSMTEDGFPVRTLLAGQLVDVAPVNDPAYLDTSTGLRSLAERAGAELEEVRAAAEAGDLKTFLTPKPTIIDLAPASRQGDPHLLLALRQRRAELYQRRTF